MIDLPQRYVITSYIRDARHPSSSVCSAYIHDRVMLQAAMPIAAKPRSAKPPAAKPRRRVARAPSPKAYHHGDLRRVLVEAALGLVEAGGVEAAQRARSGPPRRGLAGGAHFAISPVARR